MRGGVLASELVPDPLLAALPREVVVKRARSRARVGVAGTRDDRVGPFPEEVVGLAVDLLQDDTPIGERGVAVSGEGVGDLPIVVVGVEDLLDLGFGGRHGSLFNRCRGAAACRGWRLCIRRPRTWSHHSR